MFSLKEIIFYDNPKLKTSKQPKSRTSLNKLSNFVNKRKKLCKYFQKKL